ncbi:LysM peptidoglycan-binding domain-containing protein [candidate division KSB1 bacterium]|nr:LysM peptidoglycan-binding domain-containing protein [candidate division KSB1 bacterium]
MSRPGIIATVILLAVFSLNAGELFPEPEELGSNVKFWIYVYSLYSTNEIIIHDSDSLHVIYTVVNLDEFFPVNAQERTKWEKVKKEKKQFQNILLSLANKKQPVNEGKLSEKERAVYNLWRDKSQFRVAANNIRAQRGLKEEFLAGLVRSGRYMDRILEILEKYGLPSELSFLPHVESSFNYLAFSKMGAAGLWQFTRSTGRLFLQIDYTIDQRMDPFDATEAAAQLLAKNYEELGSWPLAITAYNHGLGGMKRAKTSLKTNDIGIIIQKYKSKSFGFASRNFYTEFLAAKHVAENYIYYFGDIAFEEPAKVFTFALPDYVTLQALSRVFQVEPEELAALNPSFRRPIIENKRRIPKGYVLKLPAKADFNAKDLYAGLSDTEKYATQVRDAYYKVRQGDNLYKIAQKYGTTISHLVAFNNLSNAHRIHVGQILEIPASGENPAYIGREPVAIAQNKETIKEVKGGGLAVNEMKPPVKIPEPVVRADSVAQEPLTLALETAVPEIAAAFYGPQAPAEFIQSVGEDTTTSPSSFDVNIDEPVSDWITVNPEETIGHYADWLATTASVLRKLNGMAYGREILVGQRLKLTFQNVSKKDFHSRRVEYHRSIQEDFFSHFKVVNVELYSVQSGDNIWTLAQGRFRVPFWLLARYNSGIDLLRLYPGDKIFAPVVAPLQQQAVVNDMAE